MDLLGIATQSFHLSHGISRCTGYLEALLHSLNAGDFPQSTDGDFFFFFFKEFLVLLAPYYTTGGLDGNACLHVCVLYVLSLSVVSDSLALHRL